jgi:hypothetical protein
LEENHRQCLGFCHLYQLELQKYGYLVISFQRLNKNGDVKLWCDGNYSDDGTVGDKSMVISFIFVAN